MRRSVRTERDVRGVASLAIDRRGPPYPAYRRGGRLGAWIWIRPSHGDPALVGIVQETATSIRSYQPARPILSAQPRKRTRLHAGDRALVGPGNCRNHGASG